MYGRAVTLDRYTPNENTRERQYIFKDWAEVFKDQCNKNLKELFVDEGSCRGVAVILFDGKEYWCPYYDSDEPHLHQWMDETGSSYTNYNQLTKEFYEIEDYELNVPLWLERVLDRVQDEGDIETTWENYGTTVPLII